jgi:hypothetical protein
MHSRTRLAQNVGYEPNKDMHWWHEYHASGDATMKNQRPPIILLCATRS